MENNYKNCKDPLKSIGGCVYDHGKECSCDKYEKPIRLSEDGTNVIKIMDELNAAIYKLLTFSKRKY